MVTLLLIEEKMGGGDAMKVGNGSRNLQGAPMPATAGQSSPASAAESSQGMPRVVFNAAPSFQEAKAATTDLKEAIDQICLSNSGDKCKISTEGSGVSVQSLNSELETKSCESALVPKHAFQALQCLSASSKEKAFQALQYLRANPEAQNFVASLLSNSNVWDAISEDPELKDFLHSQDKGAGFELKSNIELEESLDSDDKTSSLRSRFVPRFNYFKQNMKGTFAGMLRGDSSYLYNLSEYLSPEKMGSDGAEKPNALNTDHTNRKETFMKLAVLVATVVLFKRVPVFL